MGLSLLRANKLAAGNGEKRSGKYKSAIHDEVCPALACVDSIDLADQVLSTSCRDIQGVVLFGLHGPEGAEFAPNDGLRIAISD